MLPDDTIIMLREKLEKVFAGLRPEGILFSGGLDSSIAAALSGCKKGILVTLGDDGPDLEYALTAAGALAMALTHRAVPVAEALAAMPQVITILQSFDPALPNDLAVYFALKKAKSMGLKSVMTGDGSDELFAGYSYMASMEDLEGYLAHLTRVMSFNSTSLARHFDIQVLQPFLSEEILDFALRIRGKWKIRKEKGKVHGKWILRRALEGLLPGSILWQDKRALETGSGMTGLNAILDTVISDREFEEKKRSQGMRFFNKAHLYYYEIYREKVGEVPVPKEDEKPCEGCGAGMKQDRSHCRVCGWVEGYA
jgi:asparagine synthase (glutamine-hydrolysing)